jgi:hypothetical protein
MRLPLSLYYYAKRGIPIQRTHEAVERGDIVSIIAERPVQRTGPALVKDCYLCQGVGRPRCPNCKGTGKIVRDIRPFVTLESLREHMGILQQSLDISFEDLYGDGSGGNLPNLAIGTPAFHLREMAQYASDLFQQLILLLPEEWERMDRTLPTDDFGPLLKELRQCCNLPQPALAEKGDTDHT